MGSRFKTSTLVALSVASCAAAACNAILGIDDGVYRSGPDAPSDASASEASAFDATRSDDASPRDASPSDAPSADATPPPRCDGGCVPISVFVAKGPIVALAVADDETIYFTLEGF